MKIKYVINNEKKEQFLKQFRIKYPNWKILNFKNLYSEMIVEDEEGFVIKKTPAKLFLRSLKKTGIKEIISSVENKEEYLTKKIQKKHPNLEIIKYYNSNNILVKDENNFYYKMGYDLIIGAKVSIVSCIEKEKLILFQSNKKHNNFYEYIPFIYKNGKQKIEIICPIHGVFKQNLFNHVYGSGCQQCGKKGWSKKSWLTIAKNRLAKFYILEMFNENEKFLKIGITVREILERYKYSKLPYEFKVIKVIEDEPGKIYDLEKMILKKFKNKKIIPNKEFHGFSECLNFDILKEILELI